MTYFTDATFKFFRDLSRNNSREWFHANKPRFERDVRDPALALIGDLSAPLAAISPHFRADTRTVGGSLFRIQRDTRFANDKTPYKTWLGLRLFHERGRQTTAPVFYLHLQPGNSFLGAGVWHPEPDALKRIREFLVSNPSAWRAASAAPAFRRRFELDGDTLQRPPRGYDATHPLIEDIKRKDFVASRALDDATVLGARLRQVVIDDLRRLGPFNDYLCAALGLEF
ncbi:DUF2461 domain-containing protein [Chiayiivirga flava]|uniref:Uncharacterized protein (TIGR02453 family) n=1 Tax=Chiayiivirga flava TaxID=659595 RepID=A0A7W8FZS6_9GAMM|nr:DUF2461 domain-containing protein [Chiayiivirga flava]MBB5208431.1 uncharacterized protein (TIGR02453 family) [Chiayiivirga flava]